MEQVHGIARLLEQLVRVLKEDEQNFFRRYPVTGVLEIGCGPKSAELLAALGELAPRFPLLYRGVGTDAHSLCEARRLAHEYLPRERVHIARENIHDEPAPREEIIVSLNDGLLSSGRLSEVVATLSRMTVGPVRRCGIWSVRPGAQLSAAELKCLFLHSGWRPVLWLDPSTMRNVDIMRTNLPECLLVAMAG